mmetsp:Transcript_12555/g.38061  ORF Transcript_12555/g.38061 Transcript_12555/m.38061 type:complete len:1048 (-) Transcript_12555:87-3230(-)
MLSWANTNTYMLRRAALVCVLIQLLLCGASLGARLRLGSWNIRNVSTGSRTDAELGTIAVIIARYDLVALQEVLDEEVISRLQAILADWGLDYEYVVSAEVGTNKKERMAFMWRTDSVDLSSSPAPYVYAGNGFERPPYCGTFELAGSEQTTLCTIHVIFGENLDVRRVELALLDDVYRDAVSRTLDAGHVLICGDFNMDPEDVGWAQLRAEGLLPTVLPPTKTTVGSVSLYDNFWYPNGFPLLSDSSHVYDFDDYMWPVDSLGVVRRVQSDHRPISIGMQAGSGGSLAPELAAFPGSTSGGLAVATWFARASDSHQRTEAELGLLGMVLAHYDFVAVQGLSATELDNLVDLTTLDFELEFVKDQNTDSSLAFFYRPTVVQRTAPAFTVSSASFDVNPFCAPFTSGDYSWTACNLLATSGSVTVSVLETVRDQAASSSSLSTVLLFGHLGSSTVSLSNGALTPIVDTMSGISTTTISQSVVKDNIWYDDGSVTFVLAGSIEVLPFDEWMFPPSGDLSPTKMLSTQLPVRVLMDNGDVDFVGKPDCRLFFSEYIEGSSFDKAIEIYNPTDVTIDLSFYAISRVVNGQTSWEDASSFELQGRLEPQQTYVIVNNRANAGILAAADLETGSLIFDGNDAVGLVCDGAVIDSIGIDSEPMDDGWSVAGQSGATRDHTLIRRNYVNGPDDDWARVAGSNRYDSQWSVLPAGTLGLGSHSVDTTYNPDAAGYSLIISEYVEGSSNNKAIELYNLGSSPGNLENYNLRLVLGGGTVADDSTAIQLSGILDPRDVYVVAHPSANSAILAVAGLTTGSLRYNGNDIVALTVGLDGDVLDQIGSEGVAPAVGWSVAGVPEATFGHTLVRKETVGFGNTGDFVTSAGTDAEDSEWIVLEEDVVENLGQHSSIAGSCLLNLKRRSFTKQDPVRTVSISPRGEAQYCCADQDGCPDSSTCLNNKCVCNTGFSGLDCDIRFTTGSGSDGSGGSSGGGSSSSSGGTTGVITTGVATSSGSGVSSTTGGIPMDDADGADAASSLLCSVLLSCCLALALALHSL